MQKHTNFEGIENQLLQRFRQRNLQGDGGGERKTGESGIIGRKLYFYSVDISQTMKGLLTHVRLANQNLDTREYFNLHRELFSYAIFHTLPCHTVQYLY